MGSVGWFSCFALVLLARCLLPCLIISVWCKVFVAAGFRSHALIFIQLPLVQIYCFSGKILVFFISKQYIIIICHFFTWEMFEVKHSPV